MQSGIEIISFFAHAVDQKVAHQAINAAFDIAGMAVLGSDTAGVTYKYIHQYQTI